MDLYFQEHDVRETQSRENASSSRRNRNGALFRIANFVTRTQNVSGPPPQDMWQEHIQRVLANDTGYDESTPPKPPASAAAIRALPTVDMKPDANGQASACPICTEEFEFNEPARKLPCGHHFHGDCVIPWLQRHCTCPLCRKELPTGDGVYEAEVRQRRRQVAQAQMYARMYT